MQSGSTARALRAALFALVCVGTGTGLHRLANGCDPGWVGPGLALPLVWLGAYGLARKERSILSVTTAIALAQLGLHLELGLFCPKTMTVPGMAGMPGMTGAPGYAAAASPSATSHGTLAMILAHAVAILVSGWWLGHGEKSFFDLCRVVALIVAPAADLLAGRLAPVRVSLPPLPIRRGIHVTAPRTTCPPGGPAPSPRVLRGPPASPNPRKLRRFQPAIIM
jgi:hypothetical protein